MAAVTLPWGTEKAGFRTCQATGLKIDLAAQGLIIANAVAAVVFLLIGGIFAPLAHGSWL